MIYTITLPFPPSVNALFNGGSGQRRFPTNAYKEWQLKCPAIQNPPRIGFPVALEYTMVMPDNRVRDVGNYEKAVTDWLVKSGVILDDNYKIAPRITSQFLRVDKGNGKVYVVITEFDQKVFLSEWAKKEKEINAF